MNPQKFFAAAVGALCPHVPPPAVDYGVNISTRFRYLYVETPKVACSSVKLTLQRLELDNPAFKRASFEDLHNRSFSPLIKLSQVGDPVAFMRRSDIYKFCFVRNPYTRLISAWSDKIVGNRPQKRQILLQLGLNPESPAAADISFETFVSAVVAQPVSMMDPHWRVQYYQSLQPMLKFDFIGRFERFDHDFASVLRTLCPDRADLDNYLAREDRHKAGDVRQDELLTPDVVRAINEKYRIDFDTFGYDMLNPTGHSV